MTQVIIVVEIYFFANNSSWNFILGHSHFYET
jgi:hypothetical protein